VFCVNKIKLKTNYHENKMNNFLRINMDGWMESTSAKVTMMTMMVVVVMTRLPHK